MTKRLDGICVIKSEKDLEEHFKLDEKNLEIKRDEMNEKISQHIESCHDTLTEEEHKQLMKLNDERDEYESIFYGEWGLSFGKIEMYWSHEGAVLKNVKYCPFCGIKFEVQPID